MEPAPPPFSSNQIATATRRLQDHLALGLGVGDAHRVETVVTMLRNNVRRAPGYWIQLTLAMGIATLGLVLGSTAVVIGAMLVSPLMGPILELGMGFAVGSSLLVMRASLRVALSIAVVVGGAALLTLALPFHEVTSEIATRTAPTALDLLVAAFCALTASYTTVRPGTDATAAAAGTAIGISLVPPLCVIGFGLGTFTPATAAGAALLFTANLSAILVLSVVSFFLLGYNQVDAEMVERDFIAPPESRADHLAYRVHQSIHRVFGSRYGGAMRVLVPMTFLAMVFVPLRTALTDVTWEVRTRDTIRRILRDEDPEAMQSSLTVDRDALSIRLLIVGTPERAQALKDTLTARVGRAVGVTPTVSVVAVSNERMMRDAAASDARDPAASVPLRSISERLDDAVRLEFPAEAGAVAGWTLTLSASDTALVTLRHVGDPLGAGADALLGRAIASRVGATLRARTVALPGQWHAAATGGERAWLDSASRILAAVAGAEGVVACAEGPAAAGTQATRQHRAMADSLAARAARSATRLQLAPGARWRIRVAAGACAPGATGPAPAAAAAR